MGIWVQVSQSTTRALDLTVANGLSYFSSWFHCFDALIIVVSFTVDLVTHGIVEEIASLVVILRLWRFVKIVEELSLGASERLEEMQFKVEELEKENEELRNELRVSRGGDEV
jgi:membrane protein implicated in regulation of membrane protease activity